MTRLRGRLLYIALVFGVGIMFYRFSPVGAITQSVAGGQFGIVLAMRCAGGEMLCNPLAEALVQGGDRQIVMSGLEELRKPDKLAAGVETS